MTGSAFPRYAFCILGMHRSGTSALAGVLAQFGADVPAKMMKPTEDNPAGYFESTPVMQLNERILASAGTSWDDWSRIPEGWFKGPRASALKVEARSVLEAEFGASPLFVLKDPRICRLWPFWRDVLTDMGVTPLPVIMLRRAEEVAQSIARRDKLPPTVGRLVWLRHHVDAEEYTRGSARVVTSYDQLLNNWRAMLNEVEAMSGFTLPRRSLTTESEVEAFLKPELRRFIEGADVEEAGSGVMYGEAYDLFLAPAPSAKQRDRLNAITRSLDDFSALLHDLAAPVRMTSREAARLTRERAKLDADLAAMRAEREELTALIADKVALLDASLDVREMLTREHDEQITLIMAEKLAETEALQADWSARLDASQGARDEIARDRDDQVARVDGLLTEVQQLNALIAEKSALLDAALTARDEIARDRDDKAAEMARRFEIHAAELRAQGESTRLREAERDAARAAAMGHEETIRRLHADLGKLAESAARRETLLKQHNREEVLKERARILREIHHSHSWKLTRPLRWLGSLGRRRT